MPTFNQQQIKCFSNNPKLKDAGQSLPYDSHMISELVRCQKDPVYFIKNYVQILNVDRGIVKFDLYDYEEDFIHKMQTNRFVISKFPRQSGKSTTVIAYFLWYILFNDNVKVALLANKAETAQELMSRLQFAYECLPFWIQQGVLVWNKRSIELENGSKMRCAATSASAVRGDTYNIIFLDEFAHIQPPRLADEFYTSVYPTIMSGQTTKMFIVSTPKGMNLYYKLWIDAVEKRSNYVAVNVDWDQVPGRDEKWKEKVISDIGPDRWAQEFECQFIGSSGTLISSTKLRQLVFRNPISDVHGLNLYEFPKKEHRYCLSVDTAEGKGADYHVIQVIDVTKLPFKQVAVFRDNTSPVMLLPNIIDTIGRYYNDAQVIIEIASTGMQVADMLHYDIEYPNIIHITVKGKFGQVVGGGFSKTFQCGVKMSPAVKRMGCMNLKTLIEQDKLIIQDFNTISELTTFVDSGNGKYQAEEGCNDDTTMSLVVFAWLAAQRYFRTDDEGIDVRHNLEEENKDWINSEMLPPILEIDDGRGVDYEIDTQGIVWQSIIEK